MKKGFEEFTVTSLTAYVAGFFFPVLLLYSIRDPVSYIPFFISVIIGAAILIKYKPYKGNWFRDWLGEPRRDLTLGLATGLFVGSVPLLTNYGVQSYLLTAVGIFTMSIGAALCVKLSDDYYRWSKRYKRKGGSKA